jgi:hypothetical protein
MKQTEKAIEESRAHRGTDAERGAVGWAGLRDMPIKR